MKSWSALRALLRSKTTAAKIKIATRWFPPAAGLRRKAHLLDVYNEWSLIYSISGEHNASRALVETCVSAAVSAQDINLSALGQRSGGNSGERNALERWPGEHYRLLAALADTRKARKVVEIGTYLGASALAFLSCSAVESVVTFDIVPWDQLEDCMLLSADFGPRLRQEIADLGDRTEFERYRDLLEGADIVFIDGPKDGIFEYRFVPWLLATTPRREQLVILDDIRVMTMINLWRDIPLSKLDATTFGHFSGSGLILRNGPIIWTPPSPGMMPSYLRALPRRSAGKPDTKC